jgi:hypothetical protein
MWKCIGTVSTNVLDTVGDKEFKKAMDYAGKD